MRVQALPQSQELPVVDDELYVKTHRGTSTTDSQVKRDNRLCEVLLMNAEKFSLLASQFGQPYPQGQLQELWEKVLVRAGPRQHRWLGLCRSLPRRRDGLWRHQTCRRKDSQLRPRHHCQACKHPGRGARRPDLQSLAVGKNRPRFAGFGILRRAQHFKIVDAAGHSVPYQIEEEAGERQGAVLRRKSPGNGIQGISRGGQR